jgi:hypothetical protein
LQGGVGWLFALADKGWWRGDHTPCATIRRIAGRTWRSVPACRERPLP